MKKKEADQQKGDEQLSDNSSEYHIPVLLNEVIEGLAIKPAGTYVDCTFGGGGHSKVILQHLNENGKLVVFDQDEDAAKHVPENSRVIFVPNNFRHLQRFLRFHKITEVDGILADLGVSSHQFNEAERGFSTRYDAALDMRMDQRQKVTAADILNTYPAEKLHGLFERFGEVTNAKTLAKTVVQQRMAKKFTTIEEFKRAVYDVVKGNPNKYFAQVFQALRIEVNEEFEALKDMLIQSLQVLKSGGRIAVVTFHSGEDRLVKNFFKKGYFEDEERDEIYGNKFQSPFKLITKKPLTASEEELKKNTRSRSAKLRIAEKL
ncbi:16S rRNA (cytosine(1402)-N(4))-methyltransferase RsmH [soil metagenome]